MVFVKKSYRLTITPLSITIILLLPINVTERQQQYPLFNTITDRLLISLFVSGNSLCSIVLSEINIADCIIDLVKIFRIVIRRRHSFQSPDHLLGIIFCQHLSLRNTCVEFKFVRGIKPYYTLKRLIRCRLISNSFL